MPRNTTCWHSAWFFASHTLWLSNWTDIVIPLTVETVCKLQRQLARGKRLPCACSPAAARACLATAHRKRVIFRTVSLPPAGGIVSKGPKPVVAVAGATGQQGGGLVEAILQVH